MSSASAIAVEQLAKTHHPGLPEDVRVVLVRPRNPLNIGAAARAMLNFGFDDLVVVAPHDPVWQESRSAVGAEDVVRKARAAPDVASAIEDRTLVIGTSSLERRQISQPTVSLDRLAEVLKSGRGKRRLALVFGSEKTGLSKDDLSHCRWIARIPTIAGCPSMNLGQAVAVCCYELRRIFTGKATPLNAPPAASAAEFELLLKRIEEIIKGTRGSVATSRGYQARIRQVLLRSSMTSGDVEAALGVLRDIAWKLRLGAERNEDISKDR